MKNFKIHLFSCLISIAFLFGYSSANAQTFDFSNQVLVGGQTCGGKDCSNSTCQLTTTGGKLPETCPEGRRNDVDTACIMNKNAQPCSCMDTMPVAQISRVAETNCYRANGAGGNSKPRNHLGTDYSAPAGTVVTAAADGVIVWAKPLGGGGRAIMIEHSKNCACSASNASNSCDNKYVSVYLHLKDYIQTGGSVKKGDPIGHVGGSNYHTATGTLCDYPNSDGPCHPYGPHLHFEIHSGDFSKGYNSIKSSIIDPLCSDIQSFCGGGSSDYTTNECLNKKNDDPRETLSNEAKQSKNVTDAQGVTETNSSSAGMERTSDTNCDWQQYMPDAETCHFCPLFKVLFNTASRLAQKTYQSLAEGIAIVVVIFFALWLGLFVLKNIASLQAQKPSKMLQEILVQAFRVLLVVLILRTSYAYVLRLTLAPVFNTGMAYVQTISDTQPCKGSYMEGLIGYDKELTDKSQGALPLSMGQNILCSIKSMQDAVWKIVAYGAEVKCIAQHIKRIIFDLLPHPGYLITGLLLIVAGIVLVLAFPWCLIDCVLNMAIASALMPAAIGAWAFPKQASYLKKLWDYFMNAMFQFVFLSIILYIIMQAVQDLLSGLDAYATDYDQIVSPVTGLAFWGVNCAKLITVCLLGWFLLDKGSSLAGEFAKAPNLNIGRKTGGFFASQADRMIRGGEDEDGNRHGGIMGAAKGIGSFGKAAAGYYIATPIRGRILQNRMNNIKKNGVAIKDEDGNITGYRLETGQGKGPGLLGRLNPHKKTQYAKINPDGSMSYSEEEQSLTSQLKEAIRNKKNEKSPEGNAPEGNAPEGAENQKPNMSLKTKMFKKMAKPNSRLEKLINKYGDKGTEKKQENIPLRQIVHKDQVLAVRESVDSNGNVVQREFAFKTEADKYLIYRDGTIDMNLVQNLRQNSNLGEATINEAITHAVMRDKNMALAKTFKSRETIHQNGKTIIVQTNLDGSQTVVTSEIKNGQMLLQMRTQDKNGNVSQITDNGMVRRSTFQQQGKEAVSHYSFNERLLKNSSVKHLMNFGGKYGQFSPTINQEAAMLGFTDEDRRAFAEQEKQKKDQPNKHEKTTLDGFFDFLSGDEEKDKEEKDNIFRHLSPDAATREKEEQKRAEAEERLAEAKERWQETENKSDSDT